MAPAQRFDFRYGVFRPLLSALGFGPAFSFIELDDECLRVQMGWSFRTAIPRHSVRSARPYRGLAYGIGVHGWRGEWLVNGAASGLVEIDIDPPTRATVLGVPVRLRTLRVSVESPEDLMAALGPQG